VFDQSIQNLQEFMKIVTFVDALKLRLLWATYQYVHENIRVMDMCQIIISPMNMPLQT